MFSVNLNFEINNKKKFNLSLHGLIGVQLVRSPGKSFGRGAQFQCNHIRDIKHNCKCSK